ncbi:MAG: DinB family protein [Bacteroidetes bacterium]|nr:MAG: DinB family protein [Bacteroidota bacterium]
MNARIEKALNDLDHALEQLFKELEAYPDDLLNEPAPDGGWSVNQVLSHLLLAEDLSLKYVQKKLSYNPTLKKAGWRDQYRRFLLTLYLYAPFKFKAPKTLNSDHLPEKSSLADIRKNYEKVRAQTRAFFESAPDDLLIKEVYKHPFAGRLSLMGMLHFEKIHLARHTQQIRKTLRALKTA